MATNPESKLTLKIKKALIAEGAYVAKIHGGRYSHGIPDLIGCHRGVFFAFEVKVPGREKTLTPLQAANLKEIEEAGGLACVVTSVKQAIKLLHEWDGGA